MLDHLLIIFLISSLIIFWMQSQKKNTGLYKNLTNYLEATKDDWNYILPTELKELMEKNGSLYLLDIRKPEDFQKGHIKGAKNIFWLDLLKPNNLKKLPKNKQIVIICYVGHTSSQILVLLKLLGYNVKALKFGIGISPNPEVPIAGWTALNYQVVKK